MNADFADAGPAGARQEDPAATARELESLQSLHPRGVAEQGDHYLHAKQRATRLLTMPCEPP